jgi:hypothetical protein
MQIIHMQGQSSCPNLWDLVTLTYTSLFFFFRGIILAHLSCSSLAFLGVRKLVIATHSLLSIPFRYAVSINSSFAHSRGFSIPDALRYTIIARITPAVMSKCPRLRRKRNNSTPGLRLLRASDRHDPGCQSRRNQRTNILSSDRRRHLRNLSTSWRVGRHKPSHQLFEPVSRDADCAGGVFSGCTDHGRCHVWRRRAG